jgi:hypothetical protein
VQKNVMVNITSSSMETETLDVAWGKLIGPRGKGENASPGSELEGVTSAAQQAALADRRHMGHPLMYIVPLLTTFLSNIAAWYRQCNVWRVKQLLGLTTSNSLSAS